MVVGIPGMKILVVLRDCFIVSVVLLFFVVGAAVGMAEDILNIYIMHLNNLYVFLIGGCGRH